MKNPLNPFKTLFLVIVTLTFLPTFLVADWELQTNGLPEYTGSVNAMDACDPMTAIFADAVQLDPQHVIYKTSDGGESWTSFPISGADTLQMILDISMVDPDHIWVAGYAPSSIYATEDGGLNWELQYSDSADNFINYIEMFDTQNGVAYLDSEPVIFLTTNDGGTTWVSHQQEGMPSFSMHLWHPVDFVNPSVGYFYKNIGETAQIWKTTDGCNTWTLTTIEENVSFPVIKFYDENTGVLAGMNNIWFTTDGGETWQAKEKPEAVVGDVEFVPGDPNRIWISNYRDLLFTANGGTHWDTILSIYPGELADMVVVDNSSAWLMGTSGIYHTNNPTLVNIDPRVNQPQGFALTRVYPNPFNPSTTIQYELPEASSVTLHVYDIQGRQIQTLISELKPAGYYEAKWDGTDEAGRQVAAGMYFAKLQASDYSSVVKMVYLR